MKDIYLNYNITELAQDDMFIQWVKSSDNTNDDQWNAWLAQYPDQAEKVLKARELIEAIAWPTDTLQEDRVQAIWEQIDQNTTEKVVSINRKPLTRRNILAIAASILLLAVAGWWWLNSSPDVTTLITQETQSTETTLPGGSTIALNAVSTVSYKASSWEEKRIVALEGEAFFDVIKGSPFIVQTPVGDIEVLGTSFNVEARDNELRVICYSGRVAVKDLTGKQVILTPNQGVLFNKNGQTNFTISNENDIAWQDNVHHFQMVPLSKVFEEVERQYGVVILFDVETGQRPYSGFFESNDLNKALQNICWPMNLDYDIEGQRVTISEKE